MIATRIKSYLKREIGWAELVIISCFVVLFVWGQIQKYERNVNAAFAKGVIVGKHKGAKGSIYWDFNFYAGEELIRSYVPYDNKYKVGDTINIKYQVDNPHNNSDN